MEEVLPHWSPTYIAATQDWYSRNKELIEKCDLRGTETEVVTEAELERISLMKAPQQVLALFPIPKHTTSLARIAEKELCLVLDSVQDPGNVGTIVRLADWFGIKHIFCSHETADVFAPKAVQATMGAIARVHVHYINLKEELSQCNAPIYGTHLDGENIYKKDLTAHGVIIMGNEGKGISPEISRLVNTKLFIPPFPENSNTVESLNVAIATAIICSEFRRRQ